jgi:F420-dependent oxidoreductase-like protein
VRLGLSIMRSGGAWGPWGSGPKANLEVIKRAESMGYDSIWTAEALGTDCIVPLAYIAAHTEKIKLGTGIMQMTARPPAVTAMTAATLDSVSNGRFILGLGVSSPMIVESWHNTAFYKPLTRTREYIEIVRRVLDRDKPVDFHGELYDMPYAGPNTTGLGAPMKLMFRPRRRRIPIYLAAMGQKNVRLALEIADGLMPPIYSPARSITMFTEIGPEIKDVLEARSRRGMTTLEIVPMVPIAVGNDIDTCRKKLKPGIAFYLGSGVKGYSFYYDLAVRYGWEEPARQVADFFQQGKWAEAANAVPDEMVDEIALCGPKEHIAEQVEVWKRTSVTTMLLVGADETAIELMAELCL